MKCNGNQRFGIASSRIAVFGVGIVFGGEGLVHLCNGSCECGFWLFDVGYEVL